LFLLGHAFDPLRLDVYPEDSKGNPLLFNRLQENVNQLEATNTLTSLRFLILGAFLGHQGCLLSALNILVNLNDIGLEDNAINEEFARRLIGVISLGVNERPNKTSENFQSDASMLPATRTAEFSFLSLFLKKANQVSDFERAHYKRDYDELMSIVVYSTIVGSIESHKENIRQGHPKALLYQGIIYLSGYASDKTIQKELGGYSYLQLALTCLDKCERGLVIAKTLKALATIRYRVDLVPPHRSDGSREYRVESLREAQQSGSVWAKDFETLIFENPNQAREIAGKELDSVLQLFGL
jgi:hypothetical protein